MLVEKLLLDRGTLDLDAHLLADQHAAGVQRRLEVDAVLAAHTYYVEHMFLTIPLVGLTVLIGLVKDGIKGEPFGRNTF